MSKLLIVDDETDVCEFAKSFFTKRKIECLCASNGKRALEVIKDQKPSLVLLDIRMEGMDGIETLSKIRETDKEIKVIMVTGIEEKNTVEKAKALGALAYIHKPLVLEELEAIVLKELSSS